MRDKRVAYLGNFSVPYSTESHVAASLEGLGCHVVRIQEGETRALDVPLICRHEDVDVFLWTQTYGLAETGGTRDDRIRMVNDIRDFGIPSVAYHLDLWPQLEREHQVAEEPYFRLDHVFTTDRCNEFWERHGVNHHYLPPAVFHEEAYDGTPQRQFKSDIAFVGSWRSYAHEAHWAVREKMLHTLQRRYRGRMQFWPRRQAIRGGLLNDLYASVKVVVGDSCLAGKIPGYWSDRVPETMGRGGFLIHPHVSGIEDHHPDLAMFPAGDNDKLCEWIDFYLAEDERREMLRKSNAEHTREHHTYLNRMSTVLDTVL